MLAYKPRPVSAERALSGLLAALAASGVQTPLAPGVVARDGYGWAAWIEQRPCAGPAELAGFYRRSGTLLSLAATLNGTDLIMDNLVAAGPAPALVDAEMLTPPRLAAPELVPAGLVPADAVVQADLEQSVIDTGMLPWWIGGTDSGARDVSGLAGRPLARGPVWLHRNSADMIPVIEPRPAPRARNAPAGGDVALSVARHVGDLVAGYEEAHRWLGTHAGQVADLVGSCDLFSAAGRYTFRSTGAYDLIARRAGAPQFLGSGIGRSLALEVLANPASWSPSSRGCTPATRPPRGLSSGPSAWRWSAWTSRCSWLRPRRQT